MFVSVLMIFAHFTANVHEYEQYKDDAFGIHDVWIFHIYYISSTPIAVTF